MTQNDRNKHERRQRLNLVGESYSAASQIFAPYIRTRIVRSLRVFIPVLALIALAFLFWWPQNTAQIFNQIDTDTATDTTVIDAEYDIMKNPHYLAYDSKLQPYDVIAQSARRQVSNPDLLELETPSAMIRLHNLNSLAIQSQTGKYDQPANFLRLTGDVYIEDSRGYTLETQQMLVDIEKNTAISHVPVFGTHQRGNTIESDGMELYNNEDRVIFTGRSRLILNTQ